jgi:hypothetical protein
MNHLSIHDWDEHQTYRKDRGQPPWIKVHRHIMRNMKWVALDDAERGQLVAIWLLAADHNGVIPASPHLIQKLCFMSDTPNLQKFIDLGFLDMLGSHGDANVTPPRRQGDEPKAETEAEIEAEKRERPKRAARFQPPTLEDVSEYCRERGNRVNAAKFFHHYAANNWKRGKTTMADWKAAVRYWEQNEDENSTRTGNRSNGIAKLQRIADEDAATELGSAPVSEAESGIRATLDGTYRRH